MKKGDVGHSNLKKGINTLGDTYYYIDSEKDGYIDVAQKDKLGRIVGWMSVKLGTGIFKNTELENTDKKLHLSDVINMFLTDEKIRDESWLEGHDNNEGRSGFVHGANFVLDIIKKNCL